ncbi:MAG: hypothetical protein RR224_03360 [Clostridia bacterium]
MLVTPSVSITKSSYESWSNVKIRPTGLQYIGPSGPVYTYNYLRASLTDSGGTVLGGRIDAYVNSDAGFSSTSANQSNELRVRLYNRYYLATGSASTNKLYSDDVKSGYLKQFLPRTTVSRYILGKELACAISGFLTLTIGILAGHILVSLFVLPMETFGETAVESQLGELVGKIIIFGLSGALWAMLGMLLSTVTMNAYMAYAAPFILYYVMIILQERYARDIFMLNPQNYLTLTGTWPFGGGSAGITMAVLLIGAMLGFYVIAQDHLRDDNARKSIRTLLRQRSISLEKPFHPAHDIPVLNDLRQVRSVVHYNFRMWRGNARTRCIQRMPGDENIAYFAPAWVVFVTTKQSIEDGIEPTILAVSAIDNTYINIRG